MVSHAEASLFKTLQKMVEERERKAASIPSVTKDLKVSSVNSLNSQGDKMYLSSSSTASNLSLEARFKDLSLSSRSSYTNTWYETGSLSPGIYGPAPGVPVKVTPVSVPKSSGGGLYDSVARSTGEIRKGVEKATGRGPSLAALIEAGEAEDEEKMKKWTEEFQQMQKEHEALKTALERKTQVLSLVSATYEQNKKDFEVLQTQFTALQEENSRLKASPLVGGVLQSAYDAVKKREAELEDLLRASKVETEVLHVENETLQASTNEMEVRIKSLEEELAQANIVSGTKDDRIKSLEEELAQANIVSGTKDDRIKSLEEELAQANIVCGIKEDQIKAFEEELDKTKTESDARIKALQEELVKTKTESDARIKALQEELVKTKTESDARMKALEEELVKTKTESDARIKALEEELVQVKAEWYDKVKALEDVLTNAKIVSENEINALNEELAETKTKSEDEIKTLREELAETKTKSEDEIKTLREELAAKDEELEEKTKQLERALAMIAGTDSGGPSP
jgi:chromosome segregation ATPase